MPKKMTYQTWTELIILCRDASADYQLSPITRRIFDLSREAALKARKDAFKR
jgi:hypothetical protein